MPLWGRECPLQALAVPAYLSLVENGPVCSQLALLSHLFCEQAWQCLQFSSGQFSRSVVSDLCDPMNRSTPGLPVHHQLPEFTQTHVR